MGHKVTQTVNISGGGGGEGLIMAAVVVVGAWMVLGALAALIHALIMLLIWCSVVLGLVIVLAIVLGIVFRDRIKAHFGPPKLIYRSDTRPTPPKPVSPSAPKHELHLHFHGDTPEAVRRAVESAALAGGGTIKLPAGEYDMREVPVIRS